jgi:hypothetical protein
VGVSYHATTYEYWEWVTQDIFFDSWIRDDCIHGIKAELCEHAEAEELALSEQKVVSCLRRPGGSALKELGLVPPLELKQGPCAHKYI